MDDDDSNSNYFDEGNQLRSHSLNKKSHFNNKSNSQLSINLE